MQTYCVTIKNHVFSGLSHSTSGKLGKPARGTYCILSIDNIKYSVDKLPISNITGAVDRVRVIFYIIKFGAGE